MTAMTAAAKKIRAKRARRPVYLTVKKLVDPETGELVGALVPVHDVDARLLRERKFHTGREVRAELKQPREAWQHRLIHKIGPLVVDNVEGWEQITSHDAVKRLQRESGTCCEEIEIEVPGVGRLMVKQAESLSFDEMEQDRFQVLFDGITQHIGNSYAHVLLNDVRADFWQMAGQNRRAA
ncbi:hypothetical protein [Stenotrophomonas sp.]|uniref:hypothetical protein n=1 Tax=Stenotrophomonas sp. TaxID=69392 RepID=UPI0028ABA297|nr:hypothetical protein [Stenotrophomonas sp.]